MNKILCVHAGFEKTGTSALQAFFAINKEKLNEMGIQYPFLPNMEHRATQRAMDGYPTSGNGYHLATQLKMVPVRTRALDTLIEIINQPGQPIILLSSEYFGDMPPSLIGRLRRRFAKHQIGIRVIIYLRNTLALYISLLGIRGTAFEPLQYPEREINRSLTLEEAMIQLRLNQLLTSQSRLRKISDYMIRNFQPTGEKFNLTTLADLQFLRERHDEENTEITATCLKNGQYLALAEPPDLDSLRDEPLDPKTYFGSTPAVFLSLTQKWFQNVPRQLLPGMRLKSQN